MNSENKHIDVSKLIEKRRGKKSLWYENKDGTVVAKACSKCDSLKYLEEFPKHNSGIGGKEATCKGCKSKLYRNWYEENREYALEQDFKYNEKNRKHRAELSRKWYEENRDRALQKQQRWNKENPEMASLVHHRRRARKSALPDTLTVEEYFRTLEYFGNACALTGRTDDLEKEHAIPLSIGHGGTTFGNCYPMNKSLNVSKYNHNIFEWFEANRQRFELSQERFDNLIAYLASANAMTVEEYRAHVDWCHANPRTIDELEAL
jgi:hypothetical protein